jgi:hypothetical protein
LTADLTNLPQATYQGGTDQEYVYDLAVHPTDDIFIAGYTESLNFPTISGAPQETYGGGARDSFLARFDTSLAAGQDINLSPTSHDFGQVTLGHNSSPCEITIENQGGTDLGIELDGINLSDTVNFTLDMNGGSDPCGSLPLAIQPIDSCTLAVTFSPASQGNHSSTLNITSDDPDETTITVNFSGTTESSGSDGGDGSGGGGGCGCALSNPEGEIHLGHLIFLAIFAFYLLWWREVRRR